MIFSHQKLKSVAFGKVPMIISDSLKESQIQMATVDCSLGNSVYRMKAAAIPSKDETVEELIKKFCFYEFSLEERVGSSRALEKGACYIIPLRESLALADGLHAVFSPKSSIGRTDVFVRVLSDYGTQYDRTISGYKGPLYLEVTPLSFNIEITPGLEMTQFRLCSGEELLSDDNLACMHAQHGVIYDKNGGVLAQDGIEIFSESICFHIDLTRDIVGFEAKENPTEILNLSKKDYYSDEDFWNPVVKNGNGEIVLIPGKFYLLATKERVKIPSEYCAEILPYDVSAGEFRSHYAGFFDNGFGGDSGTNIVLEVRLRDTPQRLYDNQRICRMVFEKTDEIPEKLYGESSGSHYVGSGPSLPKHFKNRDGIWK